MRLIPCALLVVGALLGVIEAPPPSAGVVGPPAAAASAVENEPSWSAVLTGPQGDDQPEWLPLLVAYARDPRRHRTGLLALARRLPDEPPPVLLLAVADAQLRSNRPRRARHFFERALAVEPDGPWAGMAELALGWVALAGGDAAGARHRLARLIAVRDDAGAQARMLAALVDARDGRPDAALRGFRTLVDDPTAPPPLRAAADLGAAYARFWLGDLAAAAEAFRAVATRDPSAGQADDARYAAAWTLVLLDERAKGVAALEALADIRADGRRVRSVSDALIDLEPAAILRSGFDRYRRRASRPTIDEIAGVFDGDGVALARAALQRLRSPGPIAASPAALAADAPPIAAAEPLRRTALDVPASHGEQRPLPAAPSATVPWQAVAILAVTMLAVLASRTRRDRRALSASKRRSER